MFLFSPLTTTFFLFKLSILTLITFCNKGETREIFIKYGSNIYYQFNIMERLKDSSGGKGDEPNIRYFENFLLLLKNPYSAVFFLGIAAAYKNYAFIFTLPVILIYGDSLKKKLILLAISALPSLVFIVPTVLNNINEAIFALTPKSFFYYWAHVASKTGFMGCHRWNTKNTWTFIHYSFIDRKKIPGRYLVSGSVRFASRTGIRESLTGRITSIEILPLTIAECHSKPLNPLIDLLLNNNHPEKILAVLAKNKESAVFAGKVATIDQKNHTILVEMEGGQEKQVLFLAPFGEDINAGDKIAFHHGWLVCRLKDAEAARLNKINNA